MKSEPTNLAKRTPLPPSQIGDTSLNAVGNGGSYVPVVGDQPTYSASAGLPNEIIKSRELNANATAGIISKPSFGGGEPDNLIDGSGADVTNSEAMGELNTTTSGAYLDTKFSHQDAGEGGKQWQTPQ